MKTRARRLATIAGAALGLTLPAAPGWASADISCTPSWNLSAATFSCENRMFISPGNDTRINLLLLLRDRLPLAAGTPAYPRIDYPGQDFGRTFFDWGALQAAYWPDQATDFGGTGSVCVSLASGDSDFARAMAANKALPAGERVALGAARARLAVVCDSSSALRPDWPTGIASAPGKAFLAYLAAAEAFYAGHWQAAREGFAALVPGKGAKGAADPWVVEAARYMVARADLNWAMAGAFNEWGDFAGADKVDKALTRRAREELLAYIAFHPLGAYSDSARGLVRRSVWLEGDTRALAQLYEAMLGAIGGDSPDAARLVQEIDSKLLFAKDAGTAIDGPLLLATWDLMQMRQFTRGPWTEREPTESTLTLLALEAQAPRFASRPDLYQYLRALHAYTVQKDMKRVLQLVPDEARARAFGPLAFSRQVLRGLALAALHDPNEAGFWRDLLSGATALWQRPTVELALAMNYERHGRLADVFAPGSPITDPTTRSILLMHGADPALLRGAASDRTAPQRERDLATFVLLYKQLSRGDYAGFGASRALTRPGASTEGGLWDLLAAESIPVGLFSRGQTGSGDYACPALAATAATLARSSQDAPARLCLGEFWRLNGFDGFTQLDDLPPADELGGAPSLWPGKPLTRGRIYAAVIADKGAAPADKAYALYRAINCYAPSGNDSCGGGAVPVSQRKAWFDRLRRDYPQSAWARKLRYYW